MKKLLMLIIFAATLVLSACSTYQEVSSNKEENKTSEVAMEYTLEINNANNLPVEFELYSCKSGVTDNTNLLDNNKTSKIKLGLNDEEQEYKLKIKWNQENKNYQYAKVIDYVQIVLNSSQID